jgi:hypothetical protein
MRVVAQHDVTTLESTANHSPPHREDLPDEAHCMEIGVDPVNRITSKR